MCVCFIYAPWFAASDFYYISFLIVNMKTHWIFILCVWTVWLSAFTAFELYFKWLKPSVEDSLCAQWQAALLWWMSFILSWFCTHQLRATNNNLYNLLCKRPPDKRKKKDSPVLNKFYFSFFWVLIHCSITTFSDIPVKSIWTRHHVQDVTNEAQQGYQ